MTAVSDNERESNLSADTDQARADTGVPQTRSYYDLGLCVYLRATGDGCSVALVQHAPRVDKERRH